MLRVFRKDFVKKDGWVIWFWPSIMLTNIPSVVIHISFKIAGFPRLLIDIGCQLFFIYIGMMISMRRSHKEELEVGE